MMKLPFRAITTSYMRSTRRTPLPGIKARLGREHAVIEFDKRHTAAENHLHAAERMFAITGQEGTLIHAQQPNGAHVFVILPPGFKAP